MIWVIVVVAILIIFSKFKSDWKKQNLTLSVEGGVKAKYKTLIELLKAGETPEIIQDDVDLYAFGWFTPNAGNKIQIIQTFAFVTIKWDFKARIIVENKMIRLSKEWRFPEHGNQEEIAHRVLTEMTEIYNNSELGKY